MVCVTETESVYSAVRTESVNMIGLNFTSVFVWSVKCLSTFIIILKKAGPQTFRFVCRMTYLEKTFK
jgi:hypothetical protein